MVCLEDAKSMQVEAAAPPTYISEVKQHWRLILMIAIGLTLMHIKLCTSPITPDCSISQTLHIPWVNFCLHLCVLQLLIGQDDLALRVNRALSEAGNQATVSLCMNNNETILP